MTLEEGIEHYSDDKQLIEWLTELRCYRNANDNDDIVFKPRKKVKVGVVKIVGIKKRKSIFDDFR